MMDISNSDFNTLVPKELIQITTNYMKPVLVDSIPFLFPSTFHFNTEIQLILSRKLQLLFHQHKLTLWNSEFAIVVSQSESSSSIDVRMDTLTKEKLLMTTDDNEVKLFDVNHGLEHHVHTYESDVSRINALITMNDKVFITVSKNLRLFDVRVNECLHQRTIDQEISNLCFVSPTSFTTCDFQKLQLWDIRKLS